MVQKVIGQTITKGKIYVKVQAIAKLSETRVNIRFCEK